MENVGSDKEIQWIQDNAWVVNISQSTPLDWALPLYGYLMPLLVTITTITNSFIMLVLSQKHLKTPTNIVLFAMAVTDLLTGCFSIPWCLHYYTLGGYQKETMYGLNPFWCQAHAYLFEILPSISHTAATLLTVFLAVQRYIYVCVPGAVHLYCTPRTTKIALIIIFIAAIAASFPEFAGKRRTSLVRNGKHECYISLVPWVRTMIGENMFYSMYYWFRVTLHAVPCLLLLIFTYKLARTIKEAENRKKSWATTVSDPSRKASFTSRTSSVSNGRGLHATNRMLAVICTVFLLLEIPAAMVYVLQFLLANSFVRSSSSYYLFLNRILVIRNLLIVLASPIQFGIYCSMSEQFRLTVRQLFTKRLLFVTQAQATFHGGKRYSLILVDVDKVEKKKCSSSLRLARIFDRSSDAENRRTMVRQSSFPEEGPTHENEAHLVRHSFSMKPLRENKARRAVEQKYRRNKNEESMLLLENKTPSPKADIEAKSNNNLLKVPIQRYQKGNIDFV